MRRFHCSKTRLTTCRRESLLGLGSDPLFVSLHNDPRFVALIAQVTKKTVPHDSN